MILAWILTLAVIAGQMIRLPVGTHGGLNLLDACLVIFCLLGLFKVRFHLKKPPLFITASISFALIGLISLIFTPLHLTSYEYLTSFFYTVRFSLYFLFGWLLFSGAFPPLRKNINQVILFSGTGLSILGLLQFIFLPDLKFLTELGWDPHYFRTVSTFLDPNFTGGYFVLTLLFISHLLTRSGYVPGRNMMTRGVFYTLFAIVYLALLTTFSRSSYLMFLVSSLSLSFLNRSKKLAVLSILLFLTLMLGFQIYSQLVAKPRGIDREQSASLRLSTWQQGLAIFQKSPIIGVGYNSYRYAIREYNLADEQFYKSHGASANDSSLLFVLATTGILGFTVYILFLVSLLRYAIGNNLCLVAAVLGLLAHSFFANSLFYPFILIWLVLKAADTKN